MLLRVPRLNLSSQHLQCSMRRLVSALLTLLFVSACAVPQGVLDDHSIARLANKTLKEAIAFRAILRECSGYGIASARRMREIETAWWERNGALVVAADDFMIDHVGSSRVDVGNPMLLPLIALASRAERDGLALILDRPRSYPLQERRCLRWADEIATSGYALQATHGKTREVEYLQLGAMSMPPAVTGLDGLPSVIGDVHWKGKNGKAIYAAEQIAYQQCDSIELFLLNPDGSSIEDYGILCADGTQLYLRCEWGQCAQFEPTMRLLDSPLDYADDGDAAIGAPGKGDEE